MNVLARFVSFWSESLPTPMPSLLLADGTDIMGVILYFHWSCLFLDSPSYQETLTNKILMGRYRVFDFSFQKRSNRIGNEQGNTESVLTSQWFLWGFAWLTHPLARLFLNVSGGRRRLRCGGLSLIPKVGLSNQWASRVGCVAGFWYVWSNDWGPWAGWWVQ